MFGARPGHFANGRTSVKRVQALREQGDSNRRESGAQTYTRLLPRTMNKSAIYPRRESGGGLHDEATGRVSRSRGSFHRPIICGHAGVRVGRLRSERPSQLGGPMCLRWSKLKLAPETYGPYRRSRSRWDDALSSVRRSPSAPCAAGRPRSRGQSDLWVNSTAEIEFTRIL